MMNRLLLCALTLFCVAVTSVAGATNVVDSSAFIDGYPYFWTEYLANANRGVCDVTISDGASTARGPWPATTSCNSISAGEKYCLAGSGSGCGGYAISTVDSSHDPTRRGGATMLAGSIQLQRNFLTAERKLSLVSVDTATLNNYTTTSVQGRTAIPIMRFGWCGEDLSVIYEKDTLTPSAVWLTTDASCTTDAYNDVVYTAVVAGGPDPQPSSRQAYFGSQAGRSQAFVFPIERECAAYGIAITEVTHGDWWKTPLGVATRRDANWHQYSASQNSNTLTVDFRLSNNRLQKIEIIGLDKSRNNGGNFFTLYCLDPVEPDTSDITCTSPWDWDDAVDTSNPGQACCGDERTDDGLVLFDTAGNQYTCGQTGTSWAWDLVGADVLCTNREAGSAYDARFGCCTSAEVGQVNTTATDQGICADTGSSRVWLVASASDGLETITPSDTNTLVSNGSQFLTCNYQPPAPAATPAQAPAGTSRDTGQACTTTTDTSSCQFDPLFCTDSPECIECQATGNSALCTLCDDCWSESDRMYNECRASAPTTTTCTLANTACNANNVCECTAGLVWDGSACVSQCQSGYTFNGTDCVQPAPGAPTAPLTNHQTCALVRNDALQTNDGYICLSGWAAHDPTTQYLLNSSGQDVTLPPPGDPGRATARDSVTHVCQQGQKVVANRKDAPDKSDYGFCGLGQCWYLGPQVNNPNMNNVCVNATEWVRDEWCRDPGDGNATWTTRMQTIATALVNTSLASLEDFVLHCDSAPATINDPQALTDYTKERPNEAPFTNGYCVLSSLDDSGSVVVGTSLNTKRGTSQGSIITFGPPAEYPLVRPAGSLATTSYVAPFIELLNHTELATTLQSCANVDPAINNYQKCATTKGSVVYDWQSSTVLFSTDDGFDIVPSWQDNFLRLWRGTLGGASPPSILLPLTGKQVYLANRDGAQVVQGVITYTPTGTEATIAYQGIDVSSVLAPYLAANGRFSNSTVSGVQIVTIEDPTSAEWEAFTLAIRP